MIEENYFNKETLMPEEHISERIFLFCKKCDHYILVNLILNKTSIYHICPICRNELDIEKLSQFGNRKQKRRIRKNFIW